LKEILFPQYAATDARDKAAKLTPQGYKAKIRAHGRITCINIFLAAPDFGDYGKDIGILYVTLIRAVIVSAKGIPAVTLVTHEPMQEISAAIRKQGNIVAF
jgi:hypothetical protein